MQRATAEPSAAAVKARAVAAGTGAGKAAAGPVAVQERVHKCVKVWTLYLDLEESLGTVDSARAAYHKLLDLKIATPQLVRGYTLLRSSLQVWKDIEHRIILRGRPSISSLHPFTPPCIFSNRRTFVPSLRHARSSTSRRFWRSTSTSKSPSRRLRKAWRRSSGRT
jgi:hypothetical protein